MNLEKIIFGFFIILALTLNVGFVVGEISNPGHHSVWMLFSALMVSLATTLLKIGDRSQIGAIFISASLVANLLLIIAITVWAVAEGGMEVPLSQNRMVTIISLAAGALVANIVSVMILVTDTLMSRR
ncbi:MAG: hypothetical protein GY731_13190 [Gammaproteobacteria bacterium]|nr:hypothetical protein [Gammaproteobacteria bacterium]